MGLYQLPAKGLKGGSSNLMLPLMARASQTPKSRGLAGMLHMRVSAPDGAPNGEGSVIIEVRGATQLAELDPNGGTVTVIRVIGFERAGDARMHMEAWRGGYPEPLPRARAYAQSSAPGKFLAGTMVFEDHMEFLGLGDGAAQAQVRLREAMPTGLGNLDDCDAPSSPTPELNAWLNRSEESAVGGSSPWPELLPPTVGETVHTEATSRLFCSQAVPWAEEGAQCPVHWL